ncbi:hypothetical protein D6774_04570 [Candidatus Woesearchaeota archaeon]|jgi:ABC-type multidrug transport system fused ATPase/permease subunit|nr:MAG: hypothetical protein D6774_04570 [Candidatus Woesearchaeota archaeon]
MHVKKFIENCKKHPLIHHETKRAALVKFLAVLGVFLGYFAFAASRYGVDKGILVTALTWSFFVFCTPVADAGFLLDFPLRLILKIRMLYSEIFVWVFAGLLNILVLIISPQTYESTLVLRLFYTILTTPWPFWGIIILSAIGTFLSVFFGDELIDKVTHSQRKAYHQHHIKYQLVVIVFIFAAIITLYTIMLHNLGIDIPLL